MGEYWAYDLGPTRKRDIEEKHCPQIEREPPTDREREAGVVQNTILRGASDGMNCVC